MVIDENHPECRHWDICHCGRAFGWDFRGKWMIQCETFIPESMDRKLITDLRAGLSIKRICHASLPPPPQQQLPMTATAITLRLGVDITEGWWTQTRQQRQKEASIRTSTSATWCTKSVPKLEERKEDEDGTGDMGLRYASRKQVVLRPRKPWSTTNKSAMPAFYLPVSSMFQISSFISELPMSFFSKMTI